MPQHHDTIYGTLGCCWRRWRRWGSICTPWRGRIAQRRVPTCAPNPWSRCVISRVLVGTLCRVLWSWWGWPWTPSWCRVQLEWRSSSTRIAFVEQPMRSPKINWCCFLFIVIKWCTLLDRSLHCTSASPTEYRFWRTCTQFGDPKMVVIHIHSSWGTSDRSWQPIWPNWCRPGIQWCCWRYHASCSTSWSIWERLWIILLWD